MAVSRLNWTHKKRWSGVLGPVPAPGLRTRSAGRRSVQWKSLRLTLPPSTLPCPPYLPRSPLSSSLGKSRAGKEPRPSRDPKSGPAGLEQWSGKLVKRFFSPAYSPICWWPPACPVTGWALVGKKADRQSEKFLSACCYSSLSHFVPISPT